MAEDIKDKLVSLEDLGAYADTVNDATTGINLVRGSRDFTIGTEQALTGIATYEDGFYLNTVWSIDHDEQGFAIASVTGNNTSQPIITNFIKIEKTGPYTLSYDLMFDEVLETSFFATLETYIEGSNTRAEYVDLTAAKVGLDTNAVGVWHQIKYTSTFTEGNYLRLRIYPRFDNPLHVRKIKIEKGSINNPIWSPSPFDINYINDATTGINLLKGTRDFTSGYNIAKFSTRVCLDGFAIPNNENVKRYIDSDGFTVIDVDIAGKSASWLYWGDANFIDVDEGDVITLSLEVNIIELTTNYILQWYQYDSYSDSESATAVTGMVTPTLSNLGLPDHSLIEKNVWHKVVKSFTIPKGVKCIALRGLVEKNGHVQYRKFKIERGRVNNPVWSPSPFDIDYINDETTGINLLRGTRDFVQGTTILSNNYRIDGFNDNQRKYFFTKDNDGFTVASVANASSSTNYSMYFPAVYIENTVETVTFSFEFKLNEEASGTEELCALYVVGKDASGSSQTNVISLNNLGIHPTIGEWQKVVKTITFSNLDPEKQVIMGYLSCRAGSNHSYRKLSLQRGIINNPIWSPSPFDVAQDNDVLHKNYPAVNLGYIDPDNRINAGDDLNEYLFAGTYSCNQTSIVSSLSNVPSGLNRAFKLYVEYPTGSSSPLYVWQKLVEFDTAVEYIRYSGSTGATWTPWRQTYANTTVRPIEAGGTGATTAFGAAFNIFKNIAEVTTDSSDDSMFIIRQGTMTPEVGAFTYRKGSKVWNWIASKIRSVFGFTEDNKLPTITSDDIDAMLAGTYKSTGTKYASEDTIQYLIDSIKDR